MNLKDESGEILLKRCPLCHKSLLLPPLRRYSAILKESMAEVQTVKGLIYGNKKQMRTVASAIRDKITEKLIVDGLSLRFPGFGRTLAKVLETPLKMKPSYKVDIWKMNRGFLSVSQSEESCQDFRTILPIDMMCLNLNSIHLDVQRQVVFHRDNGRHLDDC
jgi:hypothetical protein